MVKKVNAANFDFNNYFSKKIPKDVATSKKIWQEKAPDIIKKNIVNTILIGNSPVKGYSRFKEYSPSYKDQILRGRYPGKKLRPVNLKLSGKMLRSLISRNTLRGFVLYFTSKLAKIHSELGAGKAGTIRKIMPKKGTSEEFKGSITQESTKMIKNLLKNKFSKL